MTTTARASRATKRTAALAAAVEKIDPQIKSAEIVLWQNGEKNRWPRAQRPCPCGCDERGGRTIVGYLSGSDKDGNGFTIYAPDETTYRVFAAVFPETFG